MSGGICVVVDDSLLKNILEVAEGLNGGFMHVGGHLIVECLCECSAASITLSSEVTAGFVRYLCLKKAAPKMRVACVVNGQNFQHQ
jgi:hypothetical protein